MKQKVDRFYFLLKRSRFNDTKNWMCKGGVCEQEFDGKDPEQQHVYGNRCTRGQWATETSIGNSLSK